MTRQLGVATEMVTEGNTHICCTCGSKRFVDGVRPRPNARSCGLLLSGTSPCTRTIWVAKEAVLAAARLRGDVQMTRVLLITDRKSVV